ncbi:hypothetical protein CROQUDRAFT_135266 [Cronartium quercuum f. sp. fusiforme G11]|uniref:Uncharacterized protein n=1 Tax=Cronartium quercuum f. sp. fusiforme G11 TaxID=708437 RepID=A0A9P6NC84_9BASI|nr:hypothetical protein CROQUDRAFT_135266 [Cronartium quercuum f. sp. fusiforme G11]
MPLLTTPLIGHLALWHGLLKIGSHTQIELFVGFWGVCTYYYKISDSHKIEFKSTCTTARPAYSFHFSDTVPDAKGDLNRTQTIFFFWYPIVLIRVANFSHELSSVAAILTGVGICLSVSGSRNFRMWRYASLVFLTAGMITLAAFAATLVIFSELTVELMKTESASLVPVHGHILAETYLPFIGSILLALASSFFFERYRQGLRDYRHSDRADLASGHNRTYWSQFRRFTTKESDEAGIDPSSPDGVQQHTRTHSQLPPPPPLQDFPIREKKR